MKIKAFTFGFGAAAVLLVVYFAVVGAISGSAFAVSQFSRYWYFIVALSIGFGVQVGLYSYLRTAVRTHMASSATIAVSGVSSTAAMVACCAHYLAILLPVLGATGVATAIAAYQIQLFWIGLIINIIGLAYIGTRVVQFRRDERIMTHNH